MVQLMFKFVTVTHQHDMKGVEPNSTQRVMITNHVSENGDPLFIRPYLTISLKLPHHFNISIFIEFPYENFLLYVVSHVLLGCLAKRSKVS